MLTILVGVGRRGAGDQWPDVKYRRSPAHGHCVEGRGRGRGGSEDPRGVGVKSSGVVFDG